jgi:uncharacterized protein HemX
MTTLPNQNFLKTIDSLKTETIEVVYPNKISALQVIRQLISDKEKSIMPILDKKAPSELMQEPVNSEQREDV